MIETGVNKTKYELNGLYYMDKPLFKKWELLAALSVIFTDFSQKNIAKKLVIKLEGLSFQHVEQNKIHYLKMKVEGDILYLHPIEVKLFPAIINRVIARCDVLNTYNEESFRIDENVEYAKHYPVLYEYLEEDEEV